MATVVGTAAQTTQSGETVVSPFPPSRHGGASGRGLIGATASGTTEPTQLGPSAPKPFYDPGPLRRET